MIEIRNDQDQVIFTTNTRNFILVGTVSNTGEVDGFKDDPLLSLVSGNKIAIVQRLGTLTQAAPKVTIVGNRVSWTFGADTTYTRGPAKIMYGVK